MKTMRLADIERKARSKGIKDTWKFTRKELIRAIQSAEGNNACFATSKFLCDQPACCWRIDCVKNPIL